MFVISIAGDVGVKLDYTAILVIAYSVEDLSIIFHLRFSIYYLG